MVKFLTTIFSIVFLMVSLPAGAQDINVAVNARVLNSIELITIQPIQLAREEAVNDVIRINPITSVNAGKMIAVGSPNTDIRISFLNRRELTNAQNSDRISFNYVVAGNDEDDQASAELINQESREFSFNEEGRFYLWIGGNVDISTAEPGNYQGEFTLEIENI